VGKSTLLAQISTNSIIYELEKASIAEGAFLWRRLESFGTNTKKRLVKMPKGHLRDTGLITRFLKIYTADDLKAHPQFGRIWEIFITEQLIRSFNNKIKQVSPYFYRTQNKAEIDLVLEGKFGIVPIEIKSGSTTEKSKENLNKIY